MSSLNIPLSFQTPKNVQRAKQLHKFCYSYPLVVNLNLINQFTIIINECTVKPMVKNQKQSGLTLSVKIDLKTSSTKLSDNKTTNSI